MAAIISYYRLLFREIDEELIEKEHFNYFIRKIADIEEEFAKLIDRRRNKKNSLVVNYEDLVQQPYESLRGIISYLDLKLDEQALQNTLKAVPPFISKKKG